MRPRAERTVVRIVRIPAYTPIGKGTLYFRDFGTAADAKFGDGSAGLTVRAAS